MCNLPHNFSGKLTIPLLVLLAIVLMVVLVALPSYADPNFTWDRAAYWDERYPSAWAGGGEVMRDALEYAGYEILDADQLKAWMDAHISNGMPSVVVFCHDIAPDTVIESMSSRCTLRRYLDAGGKIVWYADIPMIYQGHSDGTRTDWGYNSSIIILGFDAASGPGDTQDEVAFTADGRNWGLTETWQSQRPTSHSGLRVLAKDASGYAAAWVKHYVPGDNYRGFVRLFDQPGEPNFNDVQRVAEYPNVPGPIVYYVDAVNGDNNNGGLTLETGFATIQKGIDVAVDGEVVLVYPGLYQEEINFLGKVLTVRGVAAGPAGVPVLQNPGDFAVSFYSGEGPDSILKNFIIRHSFMGIFIAGSSPTISNLTVVDNKYGIEAYAGSEPDISNTIFWNNMDGDLFGCRASYSCIERGGEGEGNIYANPLFVDPDNGDYHLRSERGRYWPEHDVWVLDKVTSPCVDGGDPTADYSGEPMPNGGCINMGAYGDTSEASLSPWQIPLPLLPDQAFNPNPADGAVGVETNIILSWTAGLNTIWHEVYFGTNPTPGAAELVSEQQTDTTFQFIPGLTPHTTFYWRVDEINCSGKTTGEIWTFTTGSALPPPPPKGRGCFLADTPVWVNGALVQISKVVSGQMVGEPHCGLATECLEQIETVEEHEGTFECRDIVLESGNRISVVDAHCFMLDSGQWIAAQDLRSGLRLKTLSGTIGIKSVATRAAPFVGKVYNLKVTGVDRYLVSEDGVIVRDY